jgi:hypothetical protein
MLWVRLPLHGTAEKGRKDCTIGDNIGLKDGEIEVATSGVGALAYANRGDSMGKAGNDEPPGKKDDKSRKLPPKPIDDEEEEDGDIATPKRDRSGEDDEPL